MPKYLGPSDVLYLEEGGKPYFQGDNVPISKELAAYMGRITSGGHRFEGVDPEARPRGSDIERAKRQAEAVDEARSRAEEAQKK